MVNWREIDMLKIKDLSKEISNRQILSTINIEVREGSIHGLIGPNGAGKTTLIKCILGLFEPEDGSVYIDNKNILNNPKLKEYIGYVGEQNHLYKNFKIKDIIELYKKVYSNFDTDRYTSLNTHFNIDDTKKIKDLSKGMKTSLNIMLNLSIKPKLLLMDEPTSGLDPIKRKKLFNILVNEVLENNTTILISSHNLNEIERISDSISLIDKGKIQYSNTIENIKSKFKKIQVVFKDTPPKNLNTWDHVIDVKMIGKVHYIITNSYTDMILARLHHHGVSFVEEVDLDLSDIFIYSVGGEYNVEESSTL